VKLPKKDKNRGEMARRFASFLSDAQLKTAIDPDLRGTPYEGYRNSEYECGYVELISNRGRRWRVWFSGTSGNLALMRGMEGHEQICTVCAHTSGTYAEEQKWACWMSQFLMLRSDEDFMLTRGNPTIEREYVIATFDEEAYRRMYGGYEGPSRLDQSIRYIRDRRHHLGIDT
jgi:hypothetical protein